jgi:CRP-like cAMP-binding protein
MVSNLTQSCAIIHSLTLPTTPQSAIDLIKSDTKVKVFQKGEFVLISEQEVQFVLGLNSGMAKFYLMDHFGNEFTIKILKAGDIFGYRHIIENELFAGYMQIIETAEVCSMSKNVFLKLLEEEITVNRRVIDNLCDDIRTAKETIANLSLKDVKHRICSILIKLHKQFSMPGSDDINVDLSREDFAKLVGVARESLSRSLSELANEKVILLDKKKIKVLDWIKLYQFSKI